MIAGTEQDKSLLSCDFSMRHRLYREGDFQRIHRRAGRKDFGSFMVWSYRKKEPTPRIGISVRRQFGCAARRNRTKRLIREFFRNNKSSFSYCDLHFIPKAPPKNMLKGDYEKKLLMDCQKLSSYKE